MSCCTFSTPAPRGCDFCIILIKAGLGHDDTSWCLLSDKKCMSGNTEGLLPLTVQAIEGVNLHQRVKAACAAVCHSVTRFHQYSPNTHTRTHTSSHFSFVVLRNHERVSFYQVTSHRLHHAPPSCFNVTLIDCDC